MLRQRTSAGSLWLTGAVPVADGGTWDVMATRVFRPVTMERDVTLMMADSNALVVQYQGGSESGALILAGHTLHLTGHVTVQTNNHTNSGLFMTDPADSLDVDGNLTFTAMDHQDAGRTSDYLTDGVIRLAGNFQQTNGYSADGKQIFAPTGTRTVFDGAAPQSVSFSYPAAAWSRFHDLEVANPTGVTFNSAVYVTGQLRSPTGVTGVLKGGGRGLTVAGLDVDGLVLDALALTSEGGALDRFDAVTFRNGSGAWTQPTIRHPGAATAFDMEGLRFLTAPTAGLYLSATDTDLLDGLPLVLDLIAPEPATTTLFLPGNAVINWPSGG